MELMPNTILLSFVENARKQSLSDEKIREMLSKEGWDDEVIKAVLVPRPITVPTLPDSSKRDLKFWVTFQYFILYVCLFISAIALSGLINHIITTNLSVSNQYNRISYYDLYDDYGYDDYSGYGFLNPVTLLLLMGGDLSRFYASSLLIAFPLFAVLFIVLRRQTMHNPLIRQFISTKILQYLALTITAIILLLCFIGLLYVLVSGDFNTRTIFHTLTPIIIFSAILGYHLIEVKDDRK